MLSDEIYETILFLIILSPDLSLATTKVLKWPVLIMILLMTLAQEIYPGLMLTIEFSIHLFRAHSSVFMPTK